MKNVWYYLTPMKKAHIKNSTNNLCWQGCGEKENLIYCWWEFYLVLPL